ncbi:MULTISPECIES: VIT1/CCC1 transporter family protein [unclassified Schaalia]|uniref:VIT1/CCC1 transporter family protein n=1 Tax=unclassified Schaalia TaxID=2691889 RepID=UPI001E3C78E7|nr:MULTISPECIES: VIT1/CCC1 family protein [unclassified Schaalia]MCD4550112.1 VIT1/CCC1 family protein [Schaalia sp. lx-260]MCD4557821.1 VIT1/CCC1 family protein [Schaalia sp. lx-100]
MTSPQNHTPTPAQIRRWRRHLAEERMEARTYRALAERRVGEERDVLLALAEAERRHEEHWLRLLGERALPAPRPSLHARIGAALARAFGTIFILAMAQRAEQRSRYDVDMDATAQMAADEHIHGEVVRGLTARSRQTLAGTFRAAVFGANDGLVSNLALVLGVAATGIDTLLILMTGVAGLLAGALSMAAGEWVSVQSQRELLDASIPDPEAHKSVTHLDVDANELALVFRARGESPEEAEAHAAAVFRQANAPATTESGVIAVRAALGDGGERTQGAAEEIGTPWHAAASSFIFFATGALIPLIPYICGASGTLAIILSAAIVGIALLFTGGVVGVLSGQAPLPRALRQLVIGYAAALVTYVLGAIFGVQTS